MKLPPGKVLFLAASGIGNTILATPMISRARAMWPNAQFDLLTSRNAFQSPLTHSGLIRDFFDLERAPLRTILHLRKSRYDISINCFPSNRWQFNVVAGLIGAETRVTHRYAEGNRWAMLMNCFAEADESLHDIEQNIRLLGMFGSNINTQSEPLIFALRPEHEQSAADWLKKSEITGCPLVGVHLGAIKTSQRKSLMNQPLGSIKTPDFEMILQDLAEVSDNGAIVIFGSADEQAGIERFLLLLPENLRLRCYRFEGSLWQTAALIRRCARFISGDTGLMHIASVFQIPQKAYFRASNPNRTAPRNPKAELVVEAECASYKYPFAISKPGKSNDKD